MVKGVCSTTWTGAGQPGFERQPKDVLDWHTKSSLDVFTEGRCSSKSAAWEGRVDRSATGKRPSTADTRLASGRPSFETRSAPHDDASGSGGRCSSIGIAHPVKGPRSMWLQAEASCLRDKATPQPRASRRLWNLLAVTIAPRTRIGVPRNVEGASTPPPLCDGLALRATHKSSGGDSHTSLSSARSISAR